MKNTDISKLIASKPPFGEPLPSIPVEDPRWAKEFQVWWWRKCNYYGIDPVKAFESMLGER